MTSSTEGLALLAPSLAYEGQILAFREACIAADRQQNGVGGLDNLSVPEWLARFPELKVISSNAYASSNRRVTALTLDIEQPIPLLKILRNRPSVKEVTEHKGDIVVTLK